MDKAKNEQLDKIKLKLEKLLAKAESAREIGSLQEAEIFMQKVNSLLTEYNLKKEDIRVKTGNPKDELVFVDIWLKEEHGWGKTDGMWMIAMYNVISVHNYCRMVRIMTHGTQNELVRVFGEPHNIDTVRYLANFIIATGKHLHKERWKAYRTSGGREKKNAFKRGYFTGLVYGIQVKLEEQQEQDEAKWEGVTALVRTNELALTEKVEETLGETSKQHHKKLTSESGLIMGTRDGQEMQINKGISNSATQTKTELK